MRTPIMAALACATLLASAAVAAPASAHEKYTPPVGAGTPVTLTSDLFTPLSLEVDRKGVSYVTQNFAGILTQVDRTGRQTTLVSAPGHEIGAVSSRNGTVYYYDGALGPTPSAVLMAKTGAGAPKALADLLAWETTKNPDTVNTYGFEGLSAACAAQFDPAGIPPSYTGLVDSHPYASLALRDGIYVADAGGNDILRVDYGGQIKTVAVLPPSAPVLATPEAVAAAGFPECAANHNYRFEPVPTDVELGPDGWLYVTSLPGGPEDASLGARGVVYKVNPHDGKVVRVAGGFVGATDLAVSKSGIIYVAELFGGAQGTGQVSIVRPGWTTGEPFLALTSPAAIELRKGTLYVTTDAFVPDSTGNPQPIGKLVTVPLTKSGHSENWVDQ